MQLFKALDPKSRMELKALKLRMSFWVFMALLGSVNLQMLVPLGIAAVRRPPDNLVNNNNQLTLLIAGALCTGAGYFLGTQSDQKEDKKDGKGGPEPLGTNDATKLVVVDPDVANLELFGENES